MRIYRIFLCILPFFCCCSGYVDIGSGEVVENYYEQELNLSLHPKSMVQMYYVVPKEMFGINYFPGYYIVISCPHFWWERGKLLSVDKYYFDAEDPERTRKYLEAAEKYGDIFYDKRGTEATDWENRHALALDINAINITSSDALNSSYPAGSSLNDLFEISVKAFYPMIQNGYKQIESHEEFRPLEDLSLGDLWLIDMAEPYLYIKLKEGSISPVVNEHQLTITMDTDQGQLVLTQRVDFSELCL